MASTVHKILLGPGLMHYNLPKGAEILHAGMQRDAVTLWFKRSIDESELENRILLLTGTGHDIDDLPKGKTWKFISTLLSENQYFVYHVFELVDDVGYRR